VVEGGGEEKHVLIDHQLDDGGIGRGVTTMELQPLGKVMQASSGSRCKRCITLICCKRCIAMIGGRSQDNDINGSISEGGGVGVTLVVGAKEKANVGRVAGGEASRDDEVSGFLGGDRVAGDNKTGKGGEFAADRTKGIMDDIAAGKKVVAVGVKGVVAEAAGGMGKELRENWQAEAAEEAQAVVGGGKAVVGMKAGVIVEGKGHHGVGKGG
jgi:hypothetical protein